MKITSHMVISKILNTFMICSLFAANFGLSQDRECDLVSIENRIEEMKKTISDSRFPLAEGRKFLETLIFQINNQYRMTLTVPDACILLIQNIDRLNLTEETKWPLMIMADLLIAENQVRNINFSDRSLKNSWHYRLYWPWDWSFFGLNKKSHHSKKNNDVMKSPEIELPAHMAIGFALAVAGALVFILPIPGAQLVGGEMAAAGGIFFLEGLAAGERPYYLDSQTGNRIDFDSP